MINSNIFTLDIIPYSFFKGTGDYILCREFLLCMQSNKVVFLSGPPLYTKIILNYKIIFSHYFSLALVFRINTLLPGEFTLWKKDLASFSLQLNQFSLDH